MTGPSRIYKMPSSKRLGFLNQCYHSHHAPALPHSMLEPGELPHNQLQEISPRREVASSVKVLMPLACEVITEQQTRYLGLMG